MPCMCNMPVYCLSNSIYHRTRFEITIPYLTLGEKGDKFVYLKEHPLKKKPFHGRLFVMVKGPYSLFELLLYEAYSFRLDLKYPKLPDKGESILQKGLRADDFDL